MKQSHRLALKEIAEVFDPLGIPWRVHQGGKHLCVVVTGPDGAEHKITVAGTPRDDTNAAHMKRTDAIRLLERMGIGFHRGARHRDRKARSQGPQPPKALVLTFDRPDHDKGPYRDPWAVLREGRA